VVELVNVVMAVKVEKQYPSKYHSWQNVGTGKFKGLVCERTSMLSCDFHKGTLILELSCLQPLCPQ